MGRKKKTTSKAPGSNSAPETREQILWALSQSEKLNQLEQENEILRHQVAAETERREVLLSAALELSNAQDIHELSTKILNKIRELTHAEGGSLYLVNKDKKTLVFSTAQNEKIKVPLSSFTLPIDNSSMAGACAFRKQIIHVPDVNHISLNEGFSFNQKMDASTGYVTRSALCIPLLKSTHEIVGVIQVLNSKRSVTFTEDDIEMARGLSGHISVALETALLYQEIEQLFEGFIQASVTAIESRDPITSGHSERVALITVEMARAVNLSNAKAFKNFNFDELQIKELRYASLLHDFGKIGVPESILLKEKKLFPAELQAIRDRFTILKLAHPQETEYLNILWQRILIANEPRVQEGKAIDDLSSLVGKEFEVLGEKYPLLKESEWKNLAITRGSLTLSDREKINAHVSHTYKFLSRIPWSKRLERVPDIAYSHHEKLDGSGYPRAIKAADIPFESQMMAIADIYDALTSPDRPYKKSLAHAQALDYLVEDSQKGKLNRELVLLFKDQKIGS